MKSWFTQQAFKHTISFDKYPYSQDYKSVVLGVIKTELSELLENFLYQRQNIELHLTFTLW